MERGPDGAYLVGSERCDIEQALRLIESALATTPLKPFFGSAPHHDMPVLADCLARRGSALRARLEQQGAWYRLGVASADGSRRCIVDHCSVNFIEQEKDLYTEWRTIEDATGAIIRFCEQGASFEEIAADPLRFRRRI